MQQKGLSYSPIQDSYEAIGEHYQEYVLGENHRLGHHIDKFFEVTRPDDGSYLHVFPDGCNDLIFSFDGENVKSYLSPSISEPFRFYFDELEWIFGVRFLPGATYSFFQDVLEYTEVDGIEACQLFKNMESIEIKLCTSSSFDNRCDMVSTYLQSCLNDDGYNPVEILISYCVSQLIDGKGVQNIDALAEATGYSNRYIRQLFKKYVGHSPKMLFSIVRAQQAMGYIKSHPEETLGQVASDFGYADQSHMNRDFKKYFNISAGAQQQSDNWTNQVIAEKERFFSKTEE